MVHRKKLPLDRPPATACVLRLSALGDTCHAVPVVRALQRAWPQTKLTWIIGKAESRLMELIDGVEFITVDKRAGFAARRDLRTKLRGRRFDVLLHMQLSFRASLVSSVVPANVRLGFDKARARELQWLFTNERIAPRSREHVLDSFLGFLEALGIQDRALRWDVPLPPAALEYAQKLIPDARPTLIISPCSSHSRRNWRPESYAAVADHAVRRHGMRVILAGGPTAVERDMGMEIERLAHVPLVNQIGRDTLPQMLALLARATAILTPDSGPAHMATMVGTPVIGLYAATNPERSGPYLSRQWCVNAYPQAALRFRGRPPERLPWWEKIEEPGVMDLIEVAPVTAKLDELLVYRTMTDILVPVSPGELLDKITILRIKVARILDAAKLANVRLELDLLEKTWRDSPFAAADVSRDERALQEVNERLWDIEDRIRDKEARQIFDREFIELARAVYHSNDERAAIKKRINTALGSRLVEEKSYKPYQLRDSAAAAGVASGPAKGASTPAA